MKQTQKQQITKKKGFFNLNKKAIIWFFKLFDRNILREYPKPMFREMNKNGFIDMIGVEIGVWEGLHILKILKHNSIKKIYGVDPFSRYDNCKIVGASNYTQQDLVQVKLKAQNNLKNSFKVELICKKSEDSINDISDELDFVYIDGNHAYSYVFNDIKMYLLKIKKGGYIGGDDWTEPQVAKAVLDSFDILDINVEGHNWWVVK